MKVSHFKEPDHHIAASKRFVNMLLEMREESKGGTTWLKGVWQLFRQGPHAARRRVGPLKGLTELLGIADDDFFQFERLAKHIADGSEAAGKSKDAEQYASFTKVVEAEIMAATMSSRENKRDLDKVLDEWMADHLRLLQADKTDGGIRVLSPAQLFVHLPLTMYVQNTLHLYQMLARLNSEVARGQFNATGPGVADPFDSKLRVVLDQGSQPYSWMVFAVMGALQILFRARQKLEVANSECALAVLASNPDPTYVPDPFSPFTKPPDCNLMFRGVWVPPKIDEHRAKYQYAFNSWSRSLAGVVFVLDFYAKVLPIAKTEDWHVLLFVSHSWKTNPWVIPVQYFGGPLVGDAEKELMVCPFMSFEFEEDCELTSDMSREELRRRADVLNKRWRLLRKSSYSICTEVLGDLETAMGPELRKLLERKQGLLSSIIDEKADKEPRGPKVTVRFVSHMEPRPAVQKLFEDDSQLLFAFPPD